MTPRGETGNDFGVRPTAEGSATGWLSCASWLLDEVIAHDDENGALANARGDELRDALRVAAERLRLQAGRRPRGVFYVGARRLVAEVWRLVEDQKLNARSMAADAALDMRDLIDTTWMPVAEDERQPTAEPPKPKASDQ